MKEKIFLGKRGLALVVVMVFTLVLLIIGATFLRLATSERISADKSIHLSKAFYLAEAGVERGRNWLNSTSTPPTSPVDPLGGLQDYGGGTYQVTVTPLSAIQYEISSTGRFGNPVVAKTLNIIMQVQSIFSYAVFGDENITMKSNSYTDSYNSQNGLYGGANVGENGDIGTNAITTDPDYAITIKNNAWVYGDAVIGSGGDPYEAIDVTDTALITGTQSSADSENELPEVIAPTGLTSKSKILLDTNQTLTLNSSGEYPSVILKSNSILTLDGNLTIYVNGPLELRSNSQLVITEGSDVTIYISGTFYQDSNTSVNNITKDPTKFTIYGTDTADEVIWYSNTEFYGALYARNADIVINSNANIYGSIIGNTIELDSNAAIHYDETLSTESGFGSSYRVISWEEEPAVWE